MRKVIQRISMSSSRVRHPSASAVRSAPLRGFIAGAILGWSVAASLPAVTPKLMDGDDVTARDKEYFEYYSFIQKNNFGPQISAENRSRMNAIVDGNDEKRVDEVVSLASPSLFIPAGDPDLRKAYAWILPIQVRKLGVADPKTSLTALRLGAMSMVARDYATAKWSLKIALDGYAARQDQPPAKKESAVPMGDDLPMGLSYYSELALQERDYDTAEACQRRLLAIYHAQGNADAEVRGEFALGRILHARGDRQGARTRYDAAFARMTGTGAGSPEARADFDTHSAVLYLDAGDRDGALREAKIVEECNELMARGVFSFHDNLSVKAASLFDPFSLAAAIGEPEPLAQRILDWKGAALESEFAITRADRAAAAHHLGDLLTRYRSARQMAATFEAQESALDKKKRLQDLADARARMEAMHLPVESRSAVLETLDDPGAQAKRLDAQLAAAGVSEARFSVTVAQVGHALAPRQALVEYLRYDQYVGNAQWQRAYGAMVFTRDGKPVWVPLGRATTLDAKVSDFRRLIGEADPRQGAELKQTLRTLREAVWSPLAKALPAGVVDVVISPDGALSFVPFAALVDAEGKFLAQDCRLSFVTSGRDLLRPMPARSGGAFVLFGNPDYLHAAAGARDKPAELTETQQRALADAGFTLGALPGTGKECQGLADLFHRRKLSVDLKTGTDASEAALRKLQSPQALHLATHGAFLPFQRIENFASLFGDDAEERSAVFLAGAQRTLNERARGIGAEKKSGNGPPEYLRKTMAQTMPGVPAFEKPVTIRTDNDGVVTAQEIGGLHLEGTWLVTLSACETGLGQARAGQGVIGLRRSFVEAGAQNLLMSLWLLDDDITPEMMADFYRRALDTGDAPRAWSETQRDWFSKLSTPDPASGRTADERFFSAVYHAGAFVLSRQGVPRAP